MASCRFHRVPVVRAVAVGSVSGPLGRKIERLLGRVCAVTLTLAGAATQHSVKLTACPLLQLSER